MDSREFQTNIHGLRISLKLRNVALLKSWKFVGNEQELNCFFQALPNLFGGAVYSFMCHHRYNFLLFTGKCMSCYFLQLGYLQVPWKTWKLHDIIPILTILGLTLKRTSVRYDLYCYDTIILSHYGQVVLDNFLVLLVEN